VRSDGGPSVLLSRTQGTTRTAAAGISIMVTQTNELAVLPYPTQAANEEFMPARIVAASTGWDPYEIWRTRIKAVYDVRAAGLTTPQFASPQP
jgi:hypothetical protein